MKLHSWTQTALIIAGFVASLTLIYSLPAQAPASKEGDKGKTKGGFGGFIKSNDPRVQNRTYHFADTNEDLPYCLYVSSKVSKDKKNPLIVSLHGLGIGPGYMCQGKAIDLAEAGGYIFVAPIGYNVGGWYGSPVMNLNGRGKKGGPELPPPPANLAELSEKDVFNVLGMMRQEFNVDPNRTYLMGHSMGGGGTWHLGLKYPDIWAGLAPIAPAIFRKPEGLDKIKDIPVILVQGDKDNLVPVAGARLWADKMKELKMTYEYIEVPGGDHISIASQNLPKIFEFFNKYSKQPKQK